MKSSVLYCALPKHVTNNVNSLGLQELDYSAGSTIDKFIKEVFKSRILEESSIRKNLRCKPLMMDVLPSNNKKKAKKKRKTLSSRERKTLGLFDIKKTEQQYTTYIPLHELWKEYMQQLLQLRNSTILKQIELKLLKADYHGCIITAIPKKNSIFTFELEDFTFRIIGDNFCFRSADRVSRKFKPKHCPDFNWSIGEEI